MSCSFWNELSTNIYQLYNYFGVRKISFIVNQRNTIWLFTFFYLNHISNSSKLMENQCLLLISWPILESVLWRSKLAHAYFVQSYESWPSDQHWAVRILSLVFYVVQLSLPKHKGLGNFWNDSNHVQDTFSGFKLHLKFKRIHNAFVVIWTD